MLITKTKEFQTICNKLRPFCKPIKGHFVDERLYYNTFFIDHNHLIATNGFILAIADISHCTINDDVFYIPSDIKIEKSIEWSENKIILDGKVEEKLLYTHKQTDYSIYKSFNYKKVIPTVEPVAIQKYDFSDYGIMKEDSNKSDVVFMHDKVVFNYNDYVETVATYEDVAVQDIFEARQNIQSVMFPMYQINNIMKINKRFILQELPESDEKSVRIITTNNYKFIISPKIC